MRRPCRSLPSLFSICIVSICIVAGCSAAPSPAPSPDPTSIAPGSPASSALPSTAQTAPPSWRWVHLQANDDDFSLCVPGEPKAKSLDFGSTDFVDMVVTGRGNRIAVEIMRNTSGPFPLEANIPRIDDREVLVKKEVISKDSWMFTQRDRQNGIVEAVVRIHDKYGEDVLCTAQTQPHPRTDEEALDEVESLCRTIVRGEQSGPCTPASRH